MSINRERMTTTQGAHASFVGILSFLLFLSWWRALKKRFNYLEIVWIPLEARHLNSFKNSFKGTSKYVFSYILDDRIICSWCLNVLMFWISNSMYSITFHVLIKISESLSTSEPNSFTLQLVVACLKFVPIFNIRSLDDCLECCISNG